MKKLALALVFAAALPLFLTAKDAKKVYAPIMMGEETVLDIKTKKDQYFVLTLDEEFDIPGREASYEAKSKKEKIDFEADLRLAGNKLYFDIDLDTKGISAVLFKTELVEGNLAIKLTVTNKKDLQTSKPVIIIGYKK